MRWRKQSRTAFGQWLGALAGLAAFCLAATALGANINWSIGDFNSGNLDLSGTVVQAVNFGSTSQTVTIGGNTATFVTSNSIIPVNGGFQNGPNDTAALTPTYTNVAGNIPLENVLRSHSWTSFSGPGAETVTLTGLVAGQSYQLQAFAHDARTAGCGAGCGAATYHLRDPSGNISSSAARNSGTFFIGTFTADAATQQFHVIGEVWDPSLSGYVLRALTGGGISATINRNTGNLSIHNGSTSPLDLLGYTVNSSFGALNPTTWLSVANNYDKPAAPTPGNGSIDPDDAWTILSSTNRELGEAELNTSGPRNGGRILAGQTLNLGNVWLKTPTEDVSVQLLRADGSLFAPPLTFTGNGGQPFALGDLNFNGTLDPGDWAIYIAGAQTILSGKTPIEAYQMGDLNGNGVNNLDDMKIFIDAYNAANGAGAFEQMLASSVPEPGAAMLIILGGIALPCGRLRRGLHMPAIAACSALLLAFVATSVQAADLFPIETSGHDFDIIVEKGLNVGDPAVRGELGSRQFYEDGLDTQTATHKPGLPRLVEGFVSPSTGNTINFAFQPFEESNVLKFISTSPAKTLTFNTPAPYGQLAIVHSGGSMSIPAEVAIVPYTINYAGGTTQSGTLSTVDWGAFPDAQLPAGIDRFRTAGRINMAGSDALTNWNNQVPESDTTANRWAIYVSEITPNNPGLNIESITFGPVSLSVSGGAPQPLNSGDDVVIFGLAGPQPGIALTLSLEVDKTSGAIVIKNPTEQHITIKGYEILSAAGALNPAGWTVPAGWDKAGGASNFALQAGSLLGSYELVAENGSTPFSLGTAYNPTVGAEDLSFRFLTIDGLVRTGTVAYISAGLPGDYNSDGKVDAADYVWWRKNDGSPGGYALWRSNFGQMAGSGTTAASAVPEPSSVLVLLAALWGTLVVRRRWRSSNFAVSIYLPAVIALCVSLIIAETSLAAAFTDRIYSFGDDPNEDAANAPGGVVGTGPGNIATPILGCCFTLDTFGPVSGSRPPLQAFGSPLYINVTTTSANLAQTRPGAAAGSRGIRFDGGSSYLLGARLGYPHTSISASGAATPGPLDYFGIIDRGFQLWVYPDAAKQGQAQEVVNDGTQHGLWINTAGNWVMRYNNASTTSSKAVAFNQWQHVMVVRPYGHMAPNGGSILYVNGEAVAAAAGAYSFTNDDLLIVGANTGATPGTANFFQGVVDDIEMIIMGNVLSGPNPPAGTYNFHLATDNDWIASPAVSGLSGIPGDVNQDSLVNQADVTALLAGWGKEKRVNNVRAGDKFTILDGDLNFDGITNIADAFVLHQALVASGSGAGFDFSLIPDGASVPEPSTLAAMWTVLCAAATLRRPRR